MTTDAAVLDRGLGEMAHYLRRYGDALCKGDRSAFANLKAQREQLAEIRRRTKEIQRAISQARRAWHGQNFEAVVAHLLPLRGQLPRSEEKRLRIAQERMKHKREPN